MHLEQTRSWQAEAEADFQRQAMGKAAALILMVTAALWYWLS